ncbi:hypothetical protein ACFXKI_49905 [Streptomyces mirabilis]|uniref:hypothetical protein n=1 Tax=Streptomyces mirabilis TaxID=68239 RepID=UPI00364E4545
MPLPRTVVTAQPGSRRGRSVFADEAVWEGADERRAKDGVRSMSALCEILLDAYARGDIHPYARMVTTAQRDGLAAAEDIDHPMDVMPRPQAA